MELSEKGEKKVPGPNKHSINFADAANRTKAYREAMKNSKPVDLTIKGGTFNRDAFDDILKNENVCGIRYYFAMTDPKEGDGVETKKPFPAIVIVGVDKDGEDMLELVVDVANVASSPAKADSWPCPPHCSSINKLNSD